MNSESPRADAAPASNIPVYTVGEISGALKRTVEQTYAMVRVRGEISGCKLHGSGHLYLSLKDAEAVIDAVCWRGNAQRLSLRPEDGMEVIATGRLTTYPGRSKYQLVIDSMEMAGEGALLKMIEDRRRRLAAEGLFAPERKRPLPFLPAVIGIVTSPTGAVIRDILHRLAERFPRHVLLWPVAVQGEAAAGQIAAAINGFNAIAPDGPVPRPDLLIVARGGGSIEDLMAFNEEIVIRAAAGSAIPLISAVGHETDTTLIDYASDKRAPTPTAAAEIAVPVRLDLLAETASMGGRLSAAAVRLLGERHLRLEALARGLPPPRRIIETAAQRLDDRAERLEIALAARFDKARSSLTNIAQRLRSPAQQLVDHARRLDQTALRLPPAMLRQTERSAERLAALSQLLESLSPYRVLERGYVLVEDRAGHPLAAADIEPGQALNLRFHDAIVPARAEGLAAKKKTKPGTPEGQSSLF